MIMRLPWGMCEEPKTLDRIGDYLSGLIVIRLNAPDNRLFFFKSTLQQFLKR
jgi:hypothetical protein